MKDFLGNELAVGDEVVFMRDNTYEVSEIGEMLYNSVMVCVREGYLYLNNTSVIKVIKE